MDECLKTHSKTQKKSADLVSNKLRIGVFQRYQMKCKSVSKKSPRYTLDTSHGVGAQLPLTAAVMEMMQALRADGLGTADHSALACYYEKLAKVEVTR